MLLLLPHTHARLKDHFLSLPLSGLLSLSLWLKTLLAKNADKVLGQKTNKQF